MTPTTLDHSAKTVSPPQPWRLLLRKYVTKDNGLVKKNSYSKLNYAPTIFNIFLTIFLTELFVCMHILFFFSNTCHWYSVYCYENTTKKVFL